MQTQNFNPVLHIPIKLNEYLCNRQSRVIIEPTLFSYDELYRDLKNKSTIADSMETKARNINFPSPKNPKFKFIDLFAGIGGFRLACQSIGGECVFSSEWDINAQKTYYANFGDIPYGDITLPETKAAIPETFDLLCGGFPCQAFSVAGYRKGFEDLQ